MKRGKMLKKKASARKYSTFKCLSHRKPCKIQKNVTKLIALRKKSYTFSKYLMPSILKYIIHISYIFHVSGEKSDYPAIPSGTNIPPAQQQLIYLFRHSFLHVSFFFYMFSLRWLYQINIYMNGFNY
jgi:hypothetical protein